MRKMFVFCSLLCLCASYAQSQRMLNLSNCTFSDEMEEPSVSRTITPVDNGYRVRYNFDKIALIPDQIYEECEIWCLAGFNLNNMPEEPAYPYASDSFAIPSGCEAHISVLTEDWVEVESNPAPARKPLLVSDSVGYSRDNVLPVKTDGIGWFPLKTVTDNGTRIYKNTHIINIGITPVQFNIDAKVSRICKELEYELKFTPSTDVNFIKALNSDYSLSDDPYLCNATLNWNIENNINKTQKDNLIRSSITDDNGVDVFYSSSQIEAPKYLIISASEYEEAVEIFSEWKRTLGFDVATAYREQWTFSDVVGEISNHENLSYLLLIGNSEQIDGSYNISTADIDIPTVISDLQYASTSGIDNQMIPDLSYGRLPVNDLTEAKTVLSKIIAYEKNTNNYGSSYTDSYLFITKFLGKGETASMRNSQTTYEISNYMSQLGKKVCNKFDAASTANPKYWSDYGKDENGIFVDPAPIPYAMQKPQYDWIVKRSDLLTEINKGYGHVFYFAHGSSKYWDSPRVDVIDASSLLNRNLSIVYSMACQTGDYSAEGCLSEKFLTSSKGGAVAVFGFTGTTYIAYTDVIAISLFNGRYPSPGIRTYVNDRIDEFSIAVAPANDKITELGLLHKLAITEVFDRFPSSKSSNLYKDYQARAFTLFGDPSMKIAESPSSLIAPSVVISDNGDILISPSNEDDVITIYNKRNNKVYNFKGDITLSNVTEMSNYVICVHGQKIKPYIIECKKGGNVGENAKEIKTVKENVVWKYYSSTNCNMDPSSDIFLDLCFSGSTVIDGMEYYNCYVWKEDEDFSKENATLIAYMREEDGKVYVRYLATAVKDAQDNGIDLIPYAPMMSVLKHDLETLSSEEFLLFDANLLVGDILDSSENVLFCDSYKVAGINQFECLGERYDEYYFTGDAGVYTFAAGLGDLTSLLPLPGAFPISYGVTNWQLVQVVNNEGNVLFDAADISSETGMKDSYAMSVREFYSTVDGMIIDKPKKRGIYIKFQFLDNGTVKTSKVLLK